MNILHISTMDYDGAGNAAFRLHLGLKSIGVDSKMLVLNQKTSDTDVVKFTQHKNFLRKIFELVNKRAIYSEFSFYKNTRPKEPEFFSSDRTVHGISKHPLVKKADIITLRWISLMINYLEFFPRIRNKPLVWRLSDANPFTGGCHILKGCTRYETGCGICPQLGSKDPNDLSRKIFKRKEKAYKGHNMHIITPSRWLASIVKNSLLFKDFDTTVIPTGVPISVFTKRDREFSRDLLGLPKDKTLILFGSAYVSENKGFRYLVQTLKVLKEKNDIYPKIALVLFGAYRFKYTISNELGFPTYSLGYINDDTLLSYVYSASDMLIIPSLYDNLPNTVVECMACGIPAIGFNSGGVPELIKPYETGLLAEVGNNEDLAQKIEHMLNHPKQRQEMGRNTRRLIEQEYTLEIQAKRYADLYKKILNNTE